MGDFNSRFELNRRRIDRAGNVVWFGVAVVFVLVIAIFTSIGFVGAKMAQAGPEAIAAQAGKAAAAFDRARSGQ